MRQIYRVIAICGVLVSAGYAADPTGTTDLHRAVYDDDIAEAGRLITSGADVNAVNRYGISSLALACGNGNAGMVKLLLQAGADPNVARNGGETPLMTASRVGRLAVVRELVDAGAKVDATERSDQTALMWAAAEGHAEVCDFLIEAGADPNRALKSGFTPLLFAARNGKTGVVKVLLAHGVDVDAATEAERPGGKSPKWGTSALRIAVENGHFETGVALLEAGANPNDQRSGYAPLHVLTWVRKPNRGDGPDGMPPPRQSGSMTSLDFARRLVGEFGADVNLPLTNGSSGGPRFGIKGATPVLLAARKADLSYLKVLAELGADLNTMNQDGTTPLLAVCGVGSTAPEEEAGVESEALETAMWLVENGANVNAVNKNGETTMHGAAYRNWPEMVSWLDEQGAQIERWNQKNKHKWTPLLIAQGFRPGNFKPSAMTEEKIKVVMKKAGVTIPPDPPLPTTDKPKKYEP
jgi:ankyrin repeat protein